MAIQTITVEPIFIRESDMPSGNLNPYAVVKALLSRVQAQYVEGVQRIGQLWRIYVSSVKIRVDLLTKKTLIISGKLVPLYEQNPFIPIKKAQKTEKINSQRLTTLSE